MGNSSNIVKRIIYYMNPKRIDSKMVKLWIFYLLMSVIFFVLPKNMIEGHILILAPIVVLFVYALTTKDVMSSLILGTFSAYILWHKLGCVGGFFDNLMTVLSDEENIEMYMSFFLCGGIIIAMKRSGSTKAFADFVVSRFGKNEKILLTASGIYAGATSIDDYVSALTAGASFTPLIEAVKKPKLALAYVVRTLSINVSEMLPFGAWGYFVIYQIADAANVSGRAEATHIFMQTIPYMFYCMVACIIALLFALGIFPKIGPMKKAYQMIEEEGIQMGEAQTQDEEEDFDENNPRTKNVSALNLILPIIVIVAALIATGLNCYLAFGIAAVFTGVLYVLQGLMTVKDYVQCTVDGFIDMMDMVMILMLGYAMQEVLYAMGMETFVESVCRAIPIPSLLPFLIFVFFCCEEYLYSLNYTLFQIAIPVLLVVLSNIPGVNVPLCLGALISASLFGANACVVSDLGVVSARSCGVKIYEQYITCQPYFILSAVIAGVMYLAAGFLL